MGIVNQGRYAACDVLVAGGGMAGIAAAIAAGRSGPATVLIEKAGWLGGMGITGATGLHSFFNVFDACPGAERRRVVAGVAQELADRVQQMGGGPGHVRMERGGDFVSMLTPVEPETFKLAAARMCLEAGVKLLLHTVVDEAPAADMGVCVMRPMTSGIFQRLAGHIAPEWPAARDIYEVALKFVLSDSRVHAANVGMRWPEEVARNVRLTEGFKPKFDVADLPRGTAAVYQTDDDMNAPAGGWE